jgi:outer membrane protein TolC
LNQLSTSIQARAEAGDASRYDAMRIAREVAIYAGRRLQLASHLKAAKGRLEVLTGADVSSLEGALLPQNDIAASEEDALALHPLIAVYDAQISRASTQATAAGRQRWPDMTLSLGRKDVDEPGFETDGHVVALGMELPIGSNGKHQAAASRSRADLLEAERQLAVQQLQAEHTAYIEQFQANKRASETLARHGDDSDASEEGALVTTARAAYNAGEISIMALLDAYRADYELQERRLEHALAARQAYIQWQKLTGK